MVLPLLQLGRSGLSHARRTRLNHLYYSSSISSRNTTQYWNLQRGYCTPNNTDNTNNNNKKNESVDSSILLIEKSLADKTYKKFYFSKEDAYAPEDKPKSNVGQAKILIFLRDCFLPEGYPHSVAKDYTMYQVWQFVQNVAGSTAFVLATHACLTSVGVGTATATPVAATVNWLLRDGLGCIGLVLYAGKFATNLDLDIKRFKFLGDILHNVGVGIEILTPLFPGYFLLLASVGNAMKSIAGLVLGATKASFNRMFSLQENMADVTAKYQSQGLVAYLLGMGIGLGVANFIPNVYGHFGAYLFLSSIHLWASINGLNRITMNTLNEQRLNIVLEHFFSGNDIITPSKAKEFERLFVLKTQTETPEIILGSSVKDAFQNPSHITKAIEEFKGEKYMIAYKKDELRVVLHESLSPLDFLRAYFNAYYLKATLFTLNINRDDGVREKDKDKEKDKEKEKEKREMNEDLRAIDDPVWLDRVIAWRKSQPSISGEENNTRELPAGWRTHSHTFTENNFSLFLLRLEAAGWATSNIPLPSQDLRSWWRVENNIENDE